MQADAVRTFHRVLCDERESRIIDVTPWRYLSSGQWEIQGVRKPRVLVDALRALSGQSIWLGYERGGWDCPPDTALETAFMLRWRDGQPTWLYVYAAPSTPAVRYVMVFTSLRRFADAKGEHMGEHPCGGYSVPSEQVRALYDETSVKLSTLEAALTGPVSDVA